MIRTKIVATIGQHPVLVVETMVRIAADVEREFPHAEWLRKFPVDGANNLDDAVALAAVELAADIGAAAIIICTLGGGTVLMDASDHFHELEAEAISRAVATGLVKPGESVVLTAGLPFRVRGTTNLIKAAVAR